MACWRSGLTHQPFTLAFTGSNPVHVIFIRAFSSAGRASALQAECRRFDPVNAHFFAGVAQLAEQLICNQQVAGSSPITGLQWRQLLTRLSFLFSVIKFLRDKTKKDLSEKSERSNARNKKSAGERTWTSTRLLPLEPESSASANSATPASRLRLDYIIILCTRGQAFFLFL